MKWSALVLACAAPLAMAGYLDAQIERRMEDPNKAALDAVLKTSNNGNGNENNKDNKNSQNVNVNGNVITVSSTEIIIIWVNNGGGATTQTVNSQTTTAGAAAAAAATHQVMVGGTGGLVYTPNEIKAAVGDMVIFTFMSQNHTVTQSAFDTPCKKITDGMDSGFMPNPNNSMVPAPQMAMQVTVATPIWLYCKQSGHCGKGMTLSINPTTEKTQAMFQAAAIAQNGTGAAAPIVGGTATSATAAVATATGAAAMVPGTGAITNGQCACSCLCGVASFPAAAIQGVGAFGGMSGAMPAAMLEKKRR